MLEGFNKLDDNVETKSSKLPTILILVIFIFILVILGLTIYLVVKSKDDDDDNIEQKSTQDRVPIIGITGMRLPDGDESLYSTDQTQIHYIAAVEKSGGIPISLPVLETFNSETIKRQVELIDALIIQGGLDVTPSLYNEEPKPELGLTDFQTDKFLIEVINQAFERKIPILGICRGLQILNVAFGGNLHQDLIYAGLASDAHKMPENETCSYKHTIKVKKNSILSKMFPNNETLYVNSFHHQAINKLSENFEIDAKSDDGIIESIHFKDESQWIFGVQFHPEQHLRCNNDFLPIFKELIKQARAYKNK